MRQYSQLYSWILNVLSMFSALSTLSRTIIPTKCLFPYPSISSIPGNTASSCLVKVGPISVAYNGNKQHFRSAEISHSYLDNCNCKKRHSHHSFY
ncbi:hypothetical protein GYMLUDRAFT_888706 [Collybiopsis luxurians FD-317 M1]|uniref:Uncharacterized protein n=1 Tax=Collybiopsis luxurians FD-317 M1 TaxID=944289 RepID=A0A0D0CA45_9AGAR|nr:hypothetical protein GYMLUDRAFT_888706 [Collybiopsis luxurians FD-317 M1]